MRTHTHAQYMRDCVESHGTTKFPKTKATTCYQPQPCYHLVSLLRSEQSYDMHLFVSAVTQRIVAQPWAGHRAMTYFEYN